ncbi:MAG: serine/threonine-protein kinase [Planctomycetota bacterium]|nr:serine/threonine-protein kinase [Planctomycetota bacterium]MDI6787595.1 serine/threonine-protein kinase [Planctomycetota bacterium]
MSLSESIPGYQIIGKLGAGGMGLVFKALETKTNRTVAIKMLYPKTVSNPSLFNNFQREAKLLIHFSYPHIIKGYYVTPPEGINGLHYLIMEYVEGESVQKLIERTQADAEKIVGLNEELSLLIIMQTASALDYLQGQNILHRDIKPDNLLLDKKRGVVKLCDLGFAQPILRGRTAQEIGGGGSQTTAGTLGYMSPEQARGQQADIRSDIFSLGATLYYMITGKTPFAGSDDVEVMAKQVLSDIQSDEIKNKGLSPLVLYFIEKMVAKEKEIRYQIPKEVIEDIQTQMEGFKSLEYHPE